MNNKLLSVIYVTLCFSISMSAFAVLGGEGVGGGDRCEHRFKSIAQDLEKWIRRGGANSLRMAVTSTKYAESMMAVIAKTRITCVGPGDVGYPVTVNDKPKECINFIDEQGVSRIRCDRIKFYSGLVDPENDPVQYRIAHHEYASLARLEKPTEDDSDYSISDQITAFLEDQIVKKLVVKPMPPTPPGDDSYLAFGSTVEEEVEVKIDESTLFHDVARRLILEVSAWPRSALSRPKNLIYDDLGHNRCKTVAEQFRNRAKENGGHLKLKFRVSPELNGSDGTLPNGKQIISGHEIMLASLEGDCVLRSLEALRFLNGESPLIPVDSRYSSYFTTVKTPLIQPIPVDNLSCRIELLERPRPFQFYLVIAHTALTLNQMVPGSRIRVPNFTYTQELGNVHKNDTAKLEELRLRGCGAVEKFKLAANSESVVAAAVFEAYPKKGPTEDTVIIEEPTTIQLRTRDSTSRFTLTSLRTEVISAKDPRVQAR